MSPKLSYLFLTLILVFVVLTNAEEDYYKILGVKRGATEQ